MQNRRWFLLIAAWWSIQVTAAPATPPVPFQARYSGFVDLAGIDMELRMQGNMNLSLTATGSGRYQMRYEVKAMLGTIEAQASGEFQDTEIRPASYEQTIYSLKKTHTQLTFDWGARTVRAVEGDKHKDLPLNGRAVDPLSLHLMVMWDLQQGRQPRQYTLINGTRLRIYKVKMEGEETLKTPLGNLRTLRITSTRERDENDKEKDAKLTTFWLAPKLGYLPVQVVHQDSGKETLRMLVEEFKPDGSRVSSNP